MTDNEVLIGASIFEYCNMEGGLVNTNINGMFELTIPKKDRVILEVHYACSWNTFLYEVKLEDEYLTIKMESKKALRKSKKIRRKIIELDNKSKK